MFLTILSLGISVQLLFCLNAPFICVVKVLGARHMTHTWPQLQQQKHKITNPVAAGTELSASSVQEHQGTWGTALLHCFFPLGQLVLFAEDSCAANYIKSEIHVLIYGYLALPMTGMQVMYTGAALLELGLHYVAGRRGKLCTSECLCWHLVSPALITGHQLMLKCLLMFCFSENHFQEKQEKMPGSDSLTLAWPFALEWWLKDHHCRSSH